MEDSDNELSLVTTKELVEELLGRCDVAAVCFLQDKDDNHTSSEFYFRGDPLTCIGLLENTKRVVFDCLDESEYNRTE
jgi:hypothetical protein